MTGKELKDILYHEKISQSEIARKLGISQQSFSQMLSASDVKSSLLERIVSVLGFDMTFFYPCKTGQQAVVNGDSSIAVNTNTGNIATGDNAVLQERVAMLERLLEEKERTIKILMEK